MKNTKYAQIAVILLALVVIGLAAWVRFHGIGFGLPYVDHPNESSYALAGRLKVEQGTAMLIGMQGYPPGIISIYAVLVRFFFDPAQPATVLIGPVRHLAALFSLMSVILAGLIAFRVDSPWAALPAMALLGLHPAVVRFTIPAAADPFLLFFILLGLLLVIEGEARPRLTVYGVLALLVAVLFKYQALFVVPLALLYPLIERLIPPALTKGRERWLHFVELAILFGLFFAWLVLLYPSTEVASAPGSFQGSPEKLTFLQLTNILNNIRQPFIVFNSSLWIGLGGLLALFWAQARANDQPRIKPLVLLLAVVLVWPVGMSLFGQPVDVAYQSLPMVAVTAVLMGIGFAGAGRAAAALAAEHVPAWSVQAGLPVLALLLTLPLIGVSLAESAERALPDTRAALRDWASGTLEGGDYVSDYDLQGVWNSAWGGYPGQTQTLVEVDNDAIEHAAQWREAGIEYLLISTWRFDQAGGSDQLLTLKRFDESPTMRGGGSMVAWVGPFERLELPALGPISLVAMTPIPQQVAPGDLIALRLFYQADAPTATPHTAFIHLIPAGAPATVLAQADLPPLIDGGRTTAGWTDPTEVFASRQFVLVLPADLRPGQYQISTGLYDPLTGFRLTAQDGQNILVLGNITVLGNVGDNE